MDSLKVEADELISEIENNADLDYSTLFKYKVDLLGLNLVVEAKIKTEEKRIADIKAVEEIKKKAEEKRIADIKAAEETINSYLKIIIVLLIIMASITLAIAIRFSKP